MFCNSTVFFLFQLYVLVRISYQPILPQVFSHKEKENFRTHRINNTSIFRSSNERWNFQPQNRGSYLQTYSHVSIKISIYAFHWSFRIQLEIETESRKKLSKRVIITRLSTNQKDLVSSSPINDHDISSLFVDYLCCFYKIFDHGPFLENKSRYINPFTWAA